MRRMTFAIGVLLAGCCAGKPPVATSRSATTQPGQQAMTNDRAAIRVEGGKVVVSVRVPTGGWTLAIDRVETNDGAAAVYATLMPPPAGAMVTQAFTTLEQSATVDASITGAALQLRRGDGGYRLAALSDQ